MDAKDLIGNIPGGKILDVATGNGNFIHFLMEGLLDYSEIIGIDIKAGLETAFAEQFGGQPVRYQQMDAAKLQFNDAEFDTVCISNSLHHMPDLPATLREMLRVLKPGGYFIVSEMFRDNQTETQMTHVHLHHWWGAVDQACGVFHGGTLRREEIIETVASLGLIELRTNNLMELSENPHNPEILAELEPVIERYIQRADGYPELQARGEELRQRLKEIGFDGATSLLVVGKKGG